MHAINDIKWIWRVEWPGGQTAKGHADTYRIAKELAERAAEVYEPDGDGFRKKPGFE